MRQIKFRIWDEENKCYVSNVTKINPNANTKHCLIREKEAQGNFLGLVFGYSDNPVIFSEKSDYGTDSYEIFGLKERFIIEQYTGLKGINGCELYENDIIRFYDIRYTKFMIGKIKFNTERGRWVIYPNVSQGRDLTAEKASKCEVIGNIHEYDWES